MKTFCHRLTKPPGSLYVKAEDSYLLLTFILKKGSASAVSPILSMEVDLDQLPKAKQLLEPCGDLEVIIQKRKLTLLCGGEDLIKNKSAEPVEDAFKFLTQIADAFCELSVTHAETVRKRRNEKDVEAEVVECLKKIDDRRQEEFTKFILLLNEKKRKIRELQKKLGLRDDDPEDIEDDIGVGVSDGDPSQAKKARVSEELLALEAPSTSRSGIREAIDEEVDDEDMFSDDAHSERAQSGAEEIDEDDSPHPLTSEREVEVEIEREEKKKEDTEIRGEEIQRAGRFPEAEREKIRRVEEEELSPPDSEVSEADSPSTTGTSRRPSGRGPPKKNALDMLDDLL